MPLRCPRHLRLTRFQTREPDMIYMACLSSPDHTWPQSQILFSGGSWYWPYQTASSFLWTLSLGTVTCCAVTRQDSRQCLRYALILAGSISDKSKMRWQKDDNSLCRTGTWAKTAWYDMTLFFSNIIGSSYIQLTI